MASDKHKENDQNVVENINSHLTSAGEKLANNKKIIYISIGVVAVVAAFVLSYFFIYRNPRLQNSWDAYSKVYLADKQGTLNDKAADAYQKEFSNFSSMPAGNLAAFSAAIAFYDKGNYDAAIKNLEKMHLSDPLMQTQATILLGDCYANKKNYAKAIETFEDAISQADGNPELVPYVLMKEANVYDAQKNYNKALECYEKIKKEYPRYTLSGDNGGNGPSIDYFIEHTKALAGKK